jgi:hypothetical protein
MTGLHDRFLGGLVGIVVLVGGGAIATGSVAWACVPQPYIVVQPRASGPAGAQVDVVGDNFERGSAEIRWNGLNGELLGKANGPTFSLTVTVPDDEEGLYSLIAISRGAQGEVGSIARAAFSLTGSDQPVVDARKATTATGEREDSSSPSPLPAMVAGGALVVAGAAAGAGAVRFSGRRRTAES